MSKEQRSHVIAAWPTAFLLVALCAIAPLAPAKAAGAYASGYAGSLPTEMYSLNRTSFVAGVPQPAAAPRRRGRRRPLGNNGVPWATFHYSNLRTAWNPNETVLNTRNVNASSFGMLYSEPVDGEVYAEPLFVPHVHVVSGGFHDLLLVATEGDSVYAFDAESGAQVWKTTYVNPPSITTFKRTACECGNIAYQQGITGTPVVDLGTQLMYFVAKTVETQGSTQTTHYRLHALNIRTGTDAMPNTDITASVVAEDSTVVLLDPVWSVQRPGVVLSGSVVYVAFGSGSDRHAVNTSGWIIAFDKSSLAQIAQFSTEVGDSQVINIWYAGPIATRLGTVWMSGAAPAVDGQGYLYFQTGNGAFDGQLDFGMSVVKLAPDDSHVVDYFTPSTWWRDANHDRDLASSGVTLLPTQRGRASHVVIGGGKTGLTYVMNALNLGHFNASGDRILSETTTNEGLWGTTAAYIGPDGLTYLIVPGGGPMTLWQVQHGSTVTLGFMSQTSDEFGGDDDAGSEPVVSSNGTTAGSAIVWTYSRVPHARKVELSLRAYDATNLANKLVELPFTFWEGNGQLISPTVANGMVFTAGESNVNAYGLL